MSTPALHAIKLKLEYYHGRGRGLFDPDGCLYCGQPTWDVLCAEHETMRLRLASQEAREVGRSEPLMTAVAALSSAPREWTEDDL